MVYEEKTYQLFHKLTSVGKIRYNELLQKKADEILFKHNHPIKYLWFKLIGRL